MRLQIGIGKVKPVQVACKVRVRGRQSQTAAAIDRDDVFNDGARFSQNQIAIGNDRRSAQRMQRLQLGRRQNGDRVALVALEFIRHAQLFAKPDDSLGLRFSKMVDGQHGGGCSLSGWALSLAGLTAAVRGAQPKGFDRQLPKNVHDGNIHKWLI